MQASMSMPEAVREHMARCDASEILLVLEGDSRTSALGLALVVCATTLPFLLGAMLSGAYQFVPHALVLVVGVPALVYWLEASPPTDIVVTVESIHLFWRQFSRASHKELPMKIVSSVRTTEDFGVKEARALRNVVVRLSTGDPLDLAFASVYRSGLKVRYRVNFPEPSPTASETTNPSLMFERVVSTALRARKQQSAP